MAWAAAISIQSDCGAMSGPCGLNTSGDPTCKAISQQINGRRLTFQSRPKKRSKCCL